MASTSNDGAVTAVLSALNTLYHDQDPASKRRANEWLEEFQHSVSPTLTGNFHNSSQDPHFIPEKDILETGKGDRNNYLRDMKRQHQRTRVID